MVQESGVNIEPAGDKGCSFGILQYNACAKNSMSVKTFLRRFPYWKDVDYQLDFWVKNIVGIYTEYHGDIRRTIVAHNNPRAGEHEEFQAACKGVDSYRYIRGRGWSCYFQDEVLGTANLLSPTIL